MKNRPASAGPRYGNWGGPGWSGGTTGDQKPFDRMDELFRIHDKGYELNKIVESDVFLVQSLRVFDSTSLGKEGKKYRKNAMDYFSLKLLLKTGGVH